MVNAETEMKCFTLYVFADFDYSASVIQQQRELAVYHLKRACSVFEFYTTDEILNCINLIVLPTAFAFPTAEAYPYWFISQDQFMTVHMCLYRTSEENPDDYLPCYVDELEDYLVMRWFNDVFFSSLNSVERVYIVDLTREMTEDQLVEFAKNARRMYDQCMNFSYYS